MSRLSDLVGRLARGEQLSEAEADDVTRGIQDLEALTDALGGMLVLGTPTLGVEIASGGFISLGSGSVIIDDKGINVENNFTAITFEDTNGDRSMIINVGNTDEFALTNQKEGEAVVLYADPANAGIKGLRWAQADASGNRMQLSLTDLMPKGNQIYLGSNNDIQIRARGVTGGSPAGETYIRMRETPDAPPEDLSQDDGGRIYFKGDKLVIQTNDGGTYRYYTIDMTAAASQEVAHTTTAP